MPDVPIVNRAIVAAPKDYDVPLSQEIILKAVRADIDGTGAAGSFLPALQLISDAGDVMWTAINTGTTIAAGGSASVTWFPGVGESAGSAGPGTILQTFGGIAPASDFTWSDITGAFHTTNFPTNTTLTKISDTSLLLCHLEGDFVAGANVPAIITMGLSVDGGNTQSVGHHVSFASGFFSVDLSRFIGVGNTGLPALSAGAHTITTQVWLLSAAANTVTARTSTSWNMEIVEIEV